MRKIRRPSVIGMLAAAVLAVVIWNGDADAQQASSEAAEANRKGVAYYNEAFYKLLPSQRTIEADRKFTAAEKEFKRALTLSPDDVEAHRNLARLYFVQKRFLAAAEHYEIVFKLVPRDIDAYVNAASAYEMAQRYDLAIETLEAARPMATNEHIVSRLNAYIKSLEKKTDDACPK
jgi:tetratricopeptide (TPR) repeat protein